MIKKFQWFSKITQYIKTYTRKKETKKEIIRFRWYEKCIIHLSIHCMYYIACLNFIAIASIGLLIISKPYFKGLALTYFPFWSNFLDWQETILSTQVTLIAIIYPLVIGLISVLIQNKSSKKIIYYIYQLHSGFMFLGLSGLSLSIYIIVGMLSKTALSDSSYAIVCLISAVWLLINLVFTMWFFIQTFYFLSNDTQNTVILRYLIYKAGQHAIEPSTASTHSIDFVESINILTAASHDALKHNDTIEFEKSIDTLIQWHIDITQSFYYQNRGKKENRLHDMYKDYASYFYLILHEYWRLIQECMSMALSNNYFYKVILCLHSRIYWQQPDLTDKEIIELIEADYHIGRLLIDGQKNKPQLENTQNAHAYKSLLDNFTSMWEKWIRTIRIRYKDINNDTQYALALIIHLKCTAWIVLESLHVDNKEAIEYGIDTLNYWFKHFTHTKFSEQRNVGSQLISYDCIEKERRNSFQKFVVNKLNENDNKVMLNHAFKNTHLDLRIITACLILINSKPENKDNTCQYVISLLEGTLLKPTDNTSLYNNIIINVNTLFSAYIRHLFSYHENNGCYRTVLVEMVEKFRDISVGTGISGRSVVIQGMTNLDSLNNAYVEIFIYYSNHEYDWQLFKEQEEIIFSNALNYDNRQLLLNNLNKWLNIAKEDTLDYRFISKEKHKNNSEIFIRSVEKLIDSIQKHQTNILIQSKIDPEIVTQIAIQSSHFINNNPLPFPIHLFNNINKNKEMDVQYHYYTPKYNRYHKLWLTKLSKNIPSPYDNAYSNHLHQHTSETILRSLFDYPISESIICNRREEFFEQVGKISRSIANPILFIGCPNTVRFIAQSRNDTALCDKYNIAIRAGYNDNECYLCHIEKCTVYSIEHLLKGSSHSILTSKNIFKSLYFKEVAENQYVQVGFEGTQNELFGSLKLSYGMKVELEKNIQCIKFEFVSS